MAMVIKGYINPLPPKLDGEKIYELKARLTRFLEEKIEKNEEAILSFTHDGMLFIFTKSPEPESEPTVTAEPILSGDQRLGPPDFSGTCRPTYRRD